MRFTIHGHENVLAEHKASLEFTHDAHLTKRGDCILGVKADYKVGNLDSLRARCTISGYGLSDTFSGYVNRDFSDDHSMVLRRSGFIDARTFLYKTNKAAIDIDRHIIERLKYPEAVFNVEIRPVKIKAVIFDFDNTLEEWSGAQEHALEMTAKKVHERFDVDAAAFRGAFEHERLKFEGKTTDPLLYGRNVWLSRAFGRLGKMVALTEIERLEEEYWGYVDEKAYLYPGVPELLRGIRLRKAILSDADGDRKWKTARIHKLGVDRLVRTIVVSNDAGANKPDPRPFLHVCKLLEVEPDECVMVGDHPETDLLGAKRLGMATVLVKQSHWGHDAPYVDFMIDGIAQFPELLDRVSSYNSKKI
jgi:HAD superfamily hydrolase (TIGR01549 family)